MRTPRLGIGLGSLLVALLIVAAVGIGSAIAVIPDNGTYYACLTKKTGAVKVINYPKKQCPAGTRLIKWNAKGPAGPQGPQGEQGPAGPADWNAIANKPAGFADGVDDAGVTSVKLRWVVGSTVILSPNAYKYASAACPAGSRVTGGGFFSSPITGLSLGQSKPSSQLDLWEVDGTNTGPYDISLSAYAICMSVEPAGAFTTAKKGLLPASVKKAMKKRGR